jgi:hypothetical protein
VMGHGGHVGRRGERRAGLMGLLSVYARRNGFGRHSFRRLVDLREGCVRPHDGHTVSVYRLPLRAHAWTRLSCRVDAFRGIHDKFGLVLVMVEYDGCARRGHAIYKTYTNRGLPMQSDGLTRLRLWMDRRCTFRWMPRKCILILEKINEYDESVWLGRARALTPMTACPCGAAVGRGAACGWTEGTPSEECLGKVFCVSNEYDQPGLCTQHSH